MKKTVLAFLAIFVIKLSLGFFLNGLLVYPDESCFFLKAKTLTETGTLSSCSDITELSIGNPYPLFSILISPIFFLLQGENALHGIFIINALLSSLIIFPLFQIIQSSIKNEKKSLFFSIIISFIPILTSYERMVMSETLFVFLGIYAFWLYKTSLEKKKTKFKIYAYTLSLLAVLTRPFGFIVPLSLLINDFFTSKNKKRLVPILVLALLAGIIVTNLFLPNAQIEIMDKTKSLKDPGNWLLILISLKNQLNSLSIETLLIPSIIFFTEIFRKKEKTFDKTKVFFISIIFLNFAISAQHIYKYLLAGFNLDVSTRYLNLPIIFICTYFFIIQSKKSENKINPLVFGTFILSLFFLTFKEMNHALNISLSPWYENLNGFIPSEIYFLYIFLPLSFVLFLFYLFNKRKTTTILISTIFVIQSIFVFIWQFNYAKTEAATPEIQFFKDKKSDILILKSYNNYINAPIRPIYFDYFRIKTLTENKTTLIHFNDIKEPSHDESDPKWREMTKEFDYIITPYKLSLDKAGETSQKDTIYINKNP
jgi:4-amino-4-deoxy-L-arabinose transferase-like glycosyltransferase